VREDQKFAKLEEDVREEEKFYKEGIERIKKYYPLPEDTRNEKTGLKNPPHEILMERASKIIFSGLEHIGKEPYLRDEPISDLLIGIGTEILLKAIILKEDPNYFIKNVREETETLSFKKCRKKIVELLSKNSRSEQMENINGILGLIRLKRNNLTHLGFHQIKGHPYDQIVAVLEFLFSHFFGEDAKPIVEKFGQYKEELSKSMTVGSTSLLAGKG
jgi:hypothetical protein